MSNNNNKQDLITEPLLVFDKAQAPSATSVPLVGSQKIKKRVTLGNPSQPVEASISDVKPGKKNDSLGIPVINQPDLTTPNLSHSDEASTSTDVNQTPYEVDESDDEAIRVLLNCAEKGKNRKQQPPPYICKVSRIHRDLSETSFIPQLVSIGLLHRETKELEEYEWVKECYLNDLLSRFEEHSAPKKTLEACLREVYTLIPKIRESYAGVKKNYSNVELARMMVMDGCFILEFFFKHDDENLHLPNKMQNQRIAMDLILLENQVPFSVLQALFRCLAPYTGTVTLSKVLDNHCARYVRLFRPLSEQNSTKDVDSDLSENNLTIDVDSDLSENNLTIDVDSDYDHLLGYLHKRYQLVAAKPSKPKHVEATKPVDEEQAGKASKPVDEEQAGKASKSVDEEEIDEPASHSIVELDRSGVNFKRHQEDEWSMTIKFKSSLFACLPFVWKPTLLMPTLVIEDFTELILRNFIAYEQSFPKDDRYYFSAYARAMDKLIDTPEDIAKLVKSKVLVNMLGSNQEAADMINKVCKNICSTNFYYTKEFKQMDEYYNRFWPKCIAMLKRKYFSNPWSAIALFAAIIVFSLSVFNTVYNVMRT